MEGGRGSGGPASHTRSFPDLVPQGDSKLSNGGFGLKIGQLLRILWSFLWRKVILKLWEMCLLGRCDYYAEYGNTILSKDGWLRSVPAPTPTPDQHLDSDFDSSSQKFDDSDSGSRCQKIYDSGSDSTYFDPDADSDSRSICWLRLRLPTPVIKKKLTLTPTPKMESAPGLTPTPESESPIFDPLTLINTAPRYGNGG